MMERIKSKSKHTQNSQKGKTQENESCDNDAHCSNAPIKSDKVGTKGSHQLSTSNTASSRPRENKYRKGLQRPRKDIKKSGINPHNNLVVSCMKCVSILLVVLYFAIPAFVKIYPAILVHVAFLNHLRWPPFINLDHPEEIGLNGTNNFMLPTSDDITVGVWHVLPEDLSSEGPSSNFGDLLHKGNPVILYLHGNAGTRAGWHRVQLYKVLSKAGFHVVTFDYRGYGDSSGQPSEDGLVDDSIKVFEWIKERSGPVPVFIWGHSLGSAVATKTAMRLNNQGAEFNGLILESPFNNFFQAASNHPFSAPFRMLPWFSWVFIEGLKTNNIRFASDENIADVTAPLLILHAVDDGVVPYELGQKLHDAAKRTKSGSVEFVTFDGEHGYGHKHIHKAPNLMDVIKNFTKSNIQNKQTVTGN